MLELVKRNIIDEILGIIMNIVLHQILAYFSNIIGKSKFIK